MYQVDVPSAVPAMPVPATAGQPGFFTGGDPVTGTPATVLTADFMNSVMMELINLVGTGGGLVPAKNDNTQVLQAVRAIAGGSVNMAAIGHIRLASGFTLNWGTAKAADSTGALAVMFDLPFTAPPPVQFASNVANSPPTAFHGTGNATKVGMTVYSSAASGQAAGAGVAFFWLAIGMS